jgi:hypothetical protein
MVAEGFRRSDGIYLELPIRVSGTDGTGRDFIEDAQTLVLSRHGAKILFARRLVPQQEVNIQCLTTGEEAVARVIGEIGEWPEGFLYGIAFVDPQANPWGIGFVGLEESPNPAGRTVMECLHCHTSEVVHLDEFDAGSRGTLFVPRAFPGRRRDELAAPTACRGYRLSRASSFPRRRESIEAL